MMLQHVNKCPLANGGPASILHLYGVSDDTDSQQHTGVDVEVPMQVYSLCAGVVTAVGKTEDKKYAVTVEYNSDACFRYMNLKSTDLQLGQRVKGGAVIGTPDKHVHIELCKRRAYDGKIRFPVRVGNRTYSKEDPLDFILNSSSLYQGGDEE